MNFSKLIVLVIVCLLTSFHCQITKNLLSEPEREDTRRTEFEIIGKVGSNILVFKNNRTK